MKHNYGISRAQNYEKQNRKQTEIDTHLHSMIEMCVVHRITVNSFECVSTVHKVTTKMCSSHLQIHTRIQPLQ